MARLKSVTSVFPLHDSAVVGYFALWWVIWAYFGYYVLIQTRSY